MGPGSAIAAMLRAAGVGGRRLQAMKKARMRTTGKRKDMKPKSKGIAG